jgi:hypothetical protein
LVGELEEEEEEEGTDCVCLIAEGVNKGDGKFCSENLRSPYVDEEVPSLPMDAGPLADALVPIDPIDPIDPLDARDPLEDELLAGWS